MQSEREKMVAGERYDPLDAELVRARGKPIEIGRDVWVAAGRSSFPGSASVLAR